MTKVTQTVIAWGEILTPEYIPKIATLVLAVWLHASNSMLTATTMPSAVEEIGGLNLLHWTFALYLVGSIVSGASVSLLVVRAGIRTTMIRAAMVYAIGSVVVALAPSMPIVLIGRILQGLGGGGLMGLVYISQDRFFPSHFVPRIVACMSLTWILAAFSGPMIGGAFATWGVWRMAYWAYAAQGLLLIVAIRALLPVENPDPAANSERIPIVRLFFLAAAIFLVSLAGADYDSLLSPLLVILGIISLVFFVFRDRDARSSRILPLQVTNLKHTLGNGVLTILLLCLCIMSFLIYAPMILIKLYDLNPFMAGLVIMVETIGWGGAAILFSGIAANREPTLIRTGSAMILLGLIGLALTLPGENLWLIIIVALFSNAGFGMMWGFIIKRVVASAPADEKDRTSALLPMTLQTGFALGAAVAGIIANSLGLSEGMNDEGIRQVAFWLFAGFVPIALLGNVFAWRFVREG